VEAGGDAGDAVAKTTRVRQPRRGNIATTYMGCINAPLLLDLRARREAFIYPAILRTSPAFSYDGRPFVYRSLARSSRAIEGAGSRNRHIERAAHRPGNVRITI